MISFKQFLKEGGGEAPGKLEIVKTPVVEAYDYGKELFEKYGRDIDKEIPNFERNYKFAQKKAKEGWTYRKDMPVINDSDVKQFQERLKNGYIDVSKPFNKDFKGNPFPEGLSGEMAKEWLEGGLAKYDGLEKDDVVKVGMTKVKISDLRPIQKQIYYDKSIKATANFGVDGTTKFLKNTYFVISNDKRIIDGHHRFLSGMLINPDLTVTALEIDLPIKKLLPLSLAYGDAIGNKRNL